MRLVKRCIGIALFFPLLVSCNTKEKSDSTTRIKSYEAKILTDKQQKNVIASSTFFDLWNSISEETGSGLVVLRKNVHAAENGVFTYNMNGTVRLNVFEQNGSIWRLQFVGSRGDITNRYRMITGWSQVIRITNPNIPGDEVDTFFNEIGVGPNADISNVSGKAKIVNGVEYVVSREGEEYTLTATILNLIPAY